LSAVDVGAGIVRSATIVDTLFSGRSRALNRHMRDDFALAAA